jgi:hypothetical protein
MDKVHMLRRYYCRDRVETQLSHVGDHTDPDGSVWHCFQGLDYNKGFIARTFTKDDRKWLREKKAWAVRKSKVDAFRDHVAKWDVVVPDMKK